MVQELERKRQSASFPETAPAANPVLFRIYSRLTPAGLRESWDEVCDRSKRSIKGDRNLHHLSKHNLSPIEGDM
jgi:ribonucleotide reductase class II